ncbi:hypothetical protein L2E82_34303 [Cichorium intybus]|uniref:Uncharacterized protein n=1 Tax=Cichorium intybus TaxID=13427 RepID=A0ACB9BLX2_CICIN|nr:hypothetical protein L2E82_34303 [Cichorium intybus]
MVFFFELDLDCDMAKGMLRMQLAVRVSSRPKLLTIAAAYTEDANRALTAMPASRHELHRRNPTRLTLQEDSSAVVGPDLLTQSNNAHVDVISMNSVAVVRQMETICQMEIEERWPWKSERK